MNDEENRGFMDRHLYRISTIMLIGVSVVSVAILALAVFGKAPGPGTPLVGEMHGASPAGECGQDDLPKFLRNHKPNIECEFGSRNSFFGDWSYLKSYHKHDDTPWITNRTRDGNPARVLAWGCGRRFKVTDPSAFWGGGGRTWDCNMRGHITMRKVGPDGKKKWVKNSVASVHHQ